MGAQELSQLKPQLDANNVKLVGVGLEELGVEDFVKGGYFKGDLYLDLKKECYKKLGFKRLNIFSLVPVLFSKTTRDAMSQSKEKKIDGNFRGDGWQAGGTLVVGKDGNALLTYKQEDPSLHVDLNQVLAALGIEGKVEVKTGTVECNDAGACAMPKKS